MIDPSLNYLGGAAKHSEHFYFHNHAPKIYAWAWKYSPSPECRAMVAKFMGYDFPIETIAPEIIDSLELFAKMGVESGMREYAREIGPRGVTILKAIRRNFKRHPELWRVRS